MIYIGNIDHGSIYIIWAKYISLAGGKHDMDKRVLVLVLVFGLALAGCAQRSKSQKIVIIGSGATFPQPQLEKWIDIYTKTHPNVEIDYTGKGSGAGQSDFEKGLVDFACSDPPLTKPIWEVLLKRGQPLQFPDIVGAVVVVYNVPGVDHLKLDGKTLAEIFMGKIRYWDDPRIRALNPGVKLPHHEIVVVHRSDASGTTKIFTTYLSLVSKEWNKSEGSGLTINWLVDATGRGVGGKGNQGVVATMKRTEYSIGYTELSYAIKENLPMVAIKNRDGNFVIANVTTMKSAIAHVSVNIPPPTKGYEENLAKLLNAPGRDSYPIVAVSHIIVWRSYPNAKKAKAIKDFVTWILTKGQSDEYIVPGYAGLPTKLTERLLKEAGW